MATQRQTAESELEEELDTEAEDENFFEGSDLEPETSYRPTSNRRRQKDELQKGTVFEQGWDLFQDSKLIKNLCTYLGKPGISCTSFVGLG